MYKSELFQRILSHVSEVTEIPSIMILSKSKSIAVVDARSILVNILAENGVYPVQIAELIDHTPASIRNLISNFDNRRKSNRIVLIYTQKVRKRMEREWKEDVT